MTEWVAVSLGALDIADNPAFPSGEILVTPVRPGVPLTLFGRGAAVWRRLVDAGPVHDSRLDDAERGIVREMAEIGLVSMRPEDENRVTSLSSAWLSSPLHEMVYALVANVALKNGIQAVFIKGPILHRQGLRERVHSGDIDVWVPAGQQHELLRHLRAWGWTEIPFDFAEEMYHSTTLEPNIWGCEIDIHFRYPGIGVSPKDAFNELVRNSEMAEFAGVACSVPTVAANAVIYALHNIRPDPKVAITSEMRRDAQKALALGGLAAVELSDRWRALAVLGPEFVAADPTLVLPKYTAGIPADWQHRQAATVAGYHFAVMRSLPWRRRPLAIWRVLWPSARTAKLSATRQGYPDDTALVAHLRRIGLGIAQIVRRRSKR